MVQTIVGVGRVFKEGGGVGMKIFYIANFKDIFSERWASWFENNGHVVIRYHLSKPKVGDIKDLKLAIKEMKPDILHSQYCGRWGALGMFTRFHPHVVTIHGSDVLLIKNWKRSMARIVLKKADLITTDGDHVIQNLKNWNIDLTKVRKINFGVDIKRFVPTERSGMPYIVVRCGPDPIYDFETFNMAHKGMVPFIKLENIPQERMPETLAKASIYVSTALSDAGISSTTAEAMSCGLPVIISDVGDNYKWIDNHYLFKPKDYERLSILIKELLDNPDERKRQGRINRQTIIDRNNYEVEMEKMERIYIEVLSMFTMKPYYDSFMLNQKRVKN